MIRQLATLICVLVHGILVSAAVASPPILIVDVNGGLPAARTLRIDVFANGKMHATGQGLPFTKDGLTKTDVWRTLSEPQLSRLRTAGEHAANSWAGEEEPWPDCKGARLEVRTAPTPVVHRSGCISGKWLARPDIAAFLAALDELLPQGWKATEVVSF